MVLGKFYPFHLGHKYLIDTALENSEFVYVLACSLSNETIGDHARGEAIAKTYKGLPVEVILVKEDLPQYPEEHENFWSIWCDVVYSRIDNIDAFFASEEYGYKFSEVLGVNFEMVDIDRKIVPISGTKIRQNVLGNWHMLPDETKNGFLSNNKPITVAIIGAESTGKTELCKYLSSYLCCNVLDEYGREYCERHVKENGGFNLSHEDYIKIIYGHGGRWVDMIKDKKPLYILDTESVMTSSWCELFLGVRLGIIGFEYVDFYILLEPDTEFVQDGTRVTDGLRDKHHQIILDTLNHINRINKTYTFDNKDGFDHRNKSILDLIVGKLISFK